MYPALCPLIRRCIAAYVTLWSHWLEPPHHAADAALPDPPFLRARAILSLFMLRERLKMKLSDAPWKMYSNASLVIHDFLFIGAGNCSVSPIMLTQPPCVDDSEPTDYSFGQRKSMLKQFYEHNNIRFIVNVSARDQFMRCAEYVRARHLPTLIFCNSLSMYPISANRTYSAAETSDLFTNLSEQGTEALQTHLNGDHVTVFLVHMEDVEHWPQDQASAAARALRLTGAVARDTFLQSVALDCAAIGIEIAWRAHCHHCCQSEGEPPKVIVHCAGGINRSPATVVWWLCRYRGLPLQEAWDLVKVQRARMFGNDVSCVLKKKATW
jgi:hypothetical protein